MFQDKGCSLGRDLQPHRYTQLNRGHRTSKQSVLDPETYLLFFIDLNPFWKDQRVDVIHPVGPSDQITPLCVGLVGMDINVF